MESKVIQNLGRLWAKIWAKMSSTRTEKQEPEGHQKMVIAITIFWCPKMAPIVAFWFLFMACWFLFTQ